MSTLKRKSQIVHKGPFIFYERGGGAGGIWGKGGACEKKQLSRAGGEHPKKIREKGGAT